MLRYIGTGNWLPGVPARDLTDDEAAWLGGAGTLVATGLYEEHPAEPPARKTRAEPKAGTQEEEPWQE